jgi:hypothetical protein
MSVHEERYCINCTDYPLPRPEPTMIPCSMCKLPTSRPDGLCSPCRMGSVASEEIPRPGEATTKENSDMAHESNRIEYWRIRPTEGGAWLYETKLTNLVGLIESETSENHSFTLEKTSLTEDEAKNMGEFDGW